MGLKSSNELAALPTDILKLKWFVHETLCSIKVKLKYLFKSFETIT